MTVRLESAAATAERDSQPETMLGADAVMRALEAEGVDVCFGMPGGAILPIYDAIARGTTVRHILVRHEQGAGHMAEGYARTSGRVGVVLATSGPGATNLVTPIANAAMDSTPVVCVTGQVRSALIGTDAFQECDIVAVTKPLVKRSWQVRDARRLAAVMGEAFAVARGGRPGPVLVDIPRDVLEAPIPVAESSPDPPRCEPERASEEAIAAVAGALEAASRPVLYIGGGAVAAAACAEVLALAERLRAPVVTTLMAKGALPEEHELCFGCPGMHGGRWANLALNEADLVLAVGARFDDRVTGRLDRFAQGARIAHFDIDPGEIGKIRHVDFPVLGELGNSLRRLRTALRGAPDTAAWLALAREWRDRFPLRYERRSARLKPQWVLERLADFGAGRDVVWTTGVGQHQMWAMQYLRCSQPRSFITSGGHGTMGFGLPAAIGAHFARPDATVVCIDGDGSFQMTAQELATAVAERVPVLVVILNNTNLGMVRQWQEMFYERRLSQVDLEAPTDCAAIARGYGALGITVDTKAELGPALVQALACGGPAVVDVHVDPREQLFPMILPGGAAVDQVEYTGDE